MGDILKVGLKADLRRNLEFFAAGVVPPQARAESGAVALPDLAVPIQQPPISLPAPKWLPPRLACVAFASPYDETHKDVFELP